MFACSECVLRNLYGSDEQYDVQVCHISTETADILNVYIAHHWLFVFCLFLI